MSTDTFFFTFSTATAEPPTGSQVRLDAAFPYEAVTKLWARWMTTDGIDAYVPLLLIGKDDELYLQDKDDHTRAVHVRVTGGAIDKGAYTEIPIAWIGTSAADLVGQQVILVVAHPEGGATPAPDVGPLLLTLEEAKRHLRITDTVHDDDVQAKLEEAQAAIVTYLAEAWNAEWTAATVPKEILTAIQLRLSSLYDFERGDPAKDQQTWDAIRRMLAQRRDQALGVGAKAAV